MAKRTWQFELDGQSHTVTLQHSWLSSKRVIRLDGRVVATGAHPLAFDVGSTDAFEVGEGHQAVVNVIATWWSLGSVFRYLLEVDGRRVDPVPRGAAGAPG
jgi:Fas apoptotic inhibitory molecule (FAIM1)